MSDILLLIMKNLKYYLSKAQKEKWAIGQFNFSDFSQIKAIIEACNNLKSPLILGTSEGESKFFGLEEAIALRNALRKKTGLPIFLNLDHGKSFEYLKKAIDAGYDMIHFDGSKLSFEENIKITKQVVKYAKRRNVLTEGEIGIIATDSSKVYNEKFEIQEELLTNPLESVKYIDKSGNDLLAISIGNFHGIEAGGKNPHLYLNRLKEIKEKTGNMFLVLHGGSGIPENDIKKAIGLGIIKININTELRLAYTNALRKTLSGDPTEIIPYKYLAEASQAVRKVVDEKLLLFGSNNRI
ncbi:MAG: fructose-bisphosphate aldolase, class II [Parcubacteria group bacterium Licking1014_1]|nr:MAG: fructose-bisphosphate aldolase, class II [Parcubacteria group bacterium Licking1014_1]